MPRWLILVNPPSMQLDHAYSRAHLLLDNHKYAMQSTSVIPKRKKKSTVNMERTYRPSATQGF